MTLGTNITKSQTLNHKGGFGVVGYAYVRVNLEHNWSYLSPESSEREALPHAWCRMPGTGFNCTGHIGGRSIGGLGALGTLNNSKWKNLVGDVHDNFHADANGDGQAKHGFVFQQDTTVTPIADGTNTTKVIVAYGWDSAGDDTATLVKQKGVRNRFCR